MANIKRTMESSLASKCAKDIYKSCKDEFSIFLKRLEDERASPYRISSIRSLLTIFEKFIIYHYKQEYKIDFAITSGILNKFNRESMVMFNDKQAHIVVDRDSTPQVRFYWLMHEMGHVISSFEEFDLPTTPDRLLVLNYAPRKLEQEKSYFDFAFKLYDQTFKRFEKEPPTRNYHALSRDDIWPLVRAYSFRNAKPDELNNLSHENFLENDKANELAISMIDTLLEKVSGNIGALESSLARIESRLEGL